MQQKIYIVDAFTEEPFAGNPAAVYVMEQPLAEEKMQLIACEFNLSETAFLLPENDGFRLRWFTPTTEVSLCGHATLAAAHILYETGKVSKDQVARFYTLSGILEAMYRENSIILNFPEEVATETAMPKHLAEALGINNYLYIGKNRFDYLVELSSED